MDLLAYREHSRKQLADKLAQRGYATDDIEATLESLQADNLLNDERFAESYLHQRMRKGFGPLRIRHELSEKGIGDDIIRLQMEGHADAWLELMQQQREKTFGPLIPEDYREKMKQARFLQNRGFSPESVMRLFR